MPRELLKVASWPSGDNNCYCVRVCVRVQCSRIFQSLHSVPFRCFFFSLSDRPNGVTCTFQCWQFALPAAAWAQHTATSYSNIDGADFLSTVCSLSLQWLYDWLLCLDMVLSWSSNSEGFGRAMTRFFLLFLAFGSTPNYIRVWIT